MLLGLVAASIVLILDQLSKYFIYNDILVDTNGIAVTSFLNIIKAWNTGVSFSMFDSHGLVGVISLSLLSLVIVGFMLNWLRKEKNCVAQLAIGFIIGGAIGNVIDRVLFGAVFDFLDVYWKTYHWPTFNIADSFICIGAFMIIFYEIFGKKTQSADAN